MGLGQDCGSHQQGLNHHDAEREQTAALPRDAYSGDGGHPDSQHQHQPGQPPCSDDHALSRIKETGHHAGVDRPLEEHEVTHRHEAGVDLPCSVEIPAFIFVEESSLEKPNAKHQMDSNQSHPEAMWRSLSVLGHAACYLLSMAEIEIGIMAHNEAGNLGALLGRLMDEPEEARICIVSSGSTDGTDRIAQTWADAHPQIRTIIEPQRRGKARAINHFPGLHVPGRACSRDHQRRHRP